VRSKYGLRNKTMRDKKRRAILHCSGEIIEAQRKISSLRQKNLCSDEIISVQRKESALIRYGFPIRYGVELF
jgi:hypothetical protein